MEFYTDHIYTYTHTHHACPQDEPSNTEVITIRVTFLVVEEARLGIGASERTREKETDVPLLSSALRSLVLSLNPSYSTTIRRGDEDEDRDAARKSCSLTDSRFRRTFTKVSTALLATSKSVGRPPK